MLPWGRSAVNSRQEPGFGPAAPRRRAQKTAGAGRIRCAHGLSGGRGRGTFGLQSLTTPQEPPMRSPVLTLLAAAALGALGCEPYTKPFSAADHNVVRASIDTFTARVLRADWPGAYKRSAGLRTPKRPRFNTWV